MYVANGLAWSYYFNYLEQALPIFEKTVKKTEHRNLSSNKLLSLVPHDCNMEELSKLDNKIEKLYNIGNGEDPFHFPVYRLTINERETKQFAIQYVEAPLKALRDMSLLEGIDAVKIATCDEEVRLLGRTLSEILAHPKAQKLQQLCMLVPVKAECLQNGGLVECIMKVVSDSCTQTDGTIGFVKDEKNTQLFVDVSQPKKATDKSSQSCQNCVTNHNQEKGKGMKFDLNVRGKQDDMNIDEKGTKETKLRRTYKENTRQKTEQEELIPATENLDSSNPNNSASKETQRSVQETGEEDTDNGANTSGINTTEMIHIANGSRQSNRKQDSLNDRQNETEL